MPDPSDYDDEDEFMDACIPQLIDEGKPREVAVAACLSMWRERGKSMRTLTKDRPSTIEKAGDGEYRFVLSDESEDAEGDIIRLAGWDLSRFKANAPALAFHKYDSPVGQWKNVRVERDALRGTLKFAPRGASQLADEVRALVDSGTLRAVSVGFAPGEMSARPNGGIEFVKSHLLLEASVVSVGANASALIEQAQARGLPTQAIAKALGVSRSLARRIPDEDTFIIELVEDEEVPEVDGGSPAAVPRHAGDYHLVDDGPPSDYARQFDPELWDQAVAWARAHDGRGAGPSNEVTVEIQRQPRPTPPRVLTVDPGQVKRGVESALREFMAGEIARRINQIRGRLD